MVPFATQRAPNRRATALAQALSHGLPSASAAATAVAVALESTIVTTADAPSVARSLLVAAATTAVSPGCSTLACSPLNRRLITATAERPVPSWAARAAHQNASGASEATRTDVI